MRCSHHLYSLWVHSIGNNAAVLRHVLDHLVERGAFNLFPLEIREGILYEVEQYHTLTYLLYEQIFSLCWRCIYKDR